MQAPTLSPYVQPIINPAFHFEAPLTAATDTSDEALVSSNAAEIYRKLQLMKPESAESLKPLCRFINSCSPRKPLIFSKRKAPFPHSFIVASKGHEKVLFISFGERIYPSRKKPLNPLCLRISGAAMVVFGQDGNIKKVVDAVKLYAHFPKVSSEDNAEIQIWRESILRRVSCTQELESDHCPENYGSFEYDGGTSRMVAIFQRRAPRDLQTLYEDTNEFTSLSPQERLKIARECSAAVAHAHEHQIIHRDIKLENFLVYGTLEIKLSDFGFAVKVEDYRQCQQPCGSLEWCSPETFYKAEDPMSSVQLGKAVDIWALGLLFYSLDGQTPESIHALAKISAIREMILTAKTRAQFLQEVCKTPQKYVLQNICMQIVNIRRAKAQSLENDRDCFQKAIRCPERNDLENIYKNLPKAIRSAGTNPTQKAILDCLKAFVKEATEKLYLLRNKMNVPRPESMLEFIRVYSKDLEADIAQDYEEKTDLIERWKNDVRRVSAPQEIRSLRDLSLAMLQHDPEKRLSLDKVLTEITHLENLLKLQALRS